MCGVVGYVGKNLSKSYIIKGLERLEYRGYDSAGFACLDAHSKMLLCHKAPGYLKNLIHELDEKPIDGYIGIGHTRWSTHGVISQENTHPQVDCQKKISVIHNGIIENYGSLKKTLKSEGHLFQSETDTEVVAHLLEKSFCQKTKSIVEATTEVVNQLQGAYALAAITEQFPEDIIVVRKGSPLCIGIGDGEMFIASDLLAFAGLTNKIVFLRDESFAIVRQDSIELYDFSGKPLLLPVQDIPIVWYDDDKYGYEHYMLKEIFEQKNAIYATVRNLSIEGEQSFWEQCNLTTDAIKRIQSITLIGCGSSWHAARIAQFYFESITQVPTSVVLASEFRYMSVFNKPDTLYIAISQSGETADTLEVVRLLKTMNISTLALTNVALSSIVREADGFFLTYAGQEISVASTKAFSTQLAALYSMAHAIAFQKGIVDRDAVHNAHNDLHIAAEILENSIETYRFDITNHLAQYYAQFEKFIFLGRHISYPFAMEAALKLKEVSYIFAQCYPAGELKHGPIALLSNDTPVVLFSTLDPLIYQKLLSNAQQVKARNGHLIVFAFEGQDELFSIADCVFSIPKVHPLLGPLAMTGLMQFFVYHIAKVLGCPIDKPRNLAKSVTVE